MQPRQPSPAHSSLTSSWLAPASACTVGQRATQRRKYSAARDTWVCGKEAGCLRQRLCHAGRVLSLEIELPAGHRRYAVRLRPKRRRRQHSYRPRLLLTSLQPGAYLLAHDFAHPDVVNELVLWEVGRRGCTALGGRRLHRSRAQLRVRVAAPGPAGGRHQVDVCVCVCGPILLEVPASNICLQVYDTGRDTLSPLLASERQGRVGAAALSAACGAPVPSLAHRMRWLASYQSSRLARICAATG